MGTTTLTQSEAQKKITTVCTALTYFLVAKNKRYGNSALEPQRVFSRADADEQIKVRMDDKLSRVKNSDELRKNDVVDLLGYLVLICVANDWLNFDDLID